jgi:hypothetical protein
MTVGDDFSSQNQTQVGDEINPSRQTPSYRGGLHERDDLPNGGK